MSTAPDPAVVVHAGIGIDDRVIADLPASGEPAPDLRDRLETMAFERGLLVLGCGPSSIRLCPPLSIDEIQADFAIETLEECLRRLA